MLQLNGIREIVSEMSGRGREQVRVVVSPYRICPLGAHIDHQVWFYAARSYCCSYVSMETELLFI